MKKLFLMAIVSVPVWINAQRLDKTTETLMTTPTISFHQQQYNLGNSTAPATTISIAGDEKEFNKDWKTYLKSTFAIEGKKNGGYTSATNVLIPQWSTDTLSFHYKTEKDGSGTKLIVITEQKGAFVTPESNPELASKVNASITTEIKNFYVKSYDKSIATQQKYYDGQVSDMEKLRKNLDKTQTKLESNSKDKQKNENKLREAGSESNKKDGDIKSLNAELQNNKKAVEQAQKEVDAQAVLITTKEGEYNRLNYSGSLSTKEGEKVIKDLGKLRKTQEKLQGNLTKASGNMTKTENALLKAEQGKSKQEAKITGLQSDINSQDSKSDNLKSDLKGVNKDIEDKQKLIDEAKANLDKLKAAKDGIARL